MSRPLLIGEAERAALGRLRERAARQPVHMPTLMEEIKTAVGDLRHRARMNGLSVPLPVGFLVSFSVETGHPAGTCRHMSISVADKNRAPHPDAAWMVAQELGFVGSLEVCKVWPEKLSNGGVAINIVQPLSIVATSDQ